MLFVPFLGAFFDDRLLPGLVVVPCTYIYACIQSNCRRRWCIYYVQVMMTDCDRPAEALLTASVTHLEF